MSLNIYIKGKENIAGKIPHNVHNNVETLFLDVKLSGTPEEKRALNEIDRCNYNSPIDVIDRFGYKLRIGNISTGCKAVLCMLNKKNLVLDTLECGINARDCIVTLCKSGSIVLRNIHEEIRDYSLDGVIDVVVGDRRFCNLDDLNDYIEELVRL